MCRATAAQHQASSLFLADLHVVEDLLVLRLVHHWAHHIGRVHGVTIGNTLHASDDQLKALFVAAAWKENSGLHRTALAGMHAHTKASHGNGVWEVSVIKEDGGRLSTELEDNALQRGGALLHDALAHASGASEGNHVHVGAQGELLRY